MWPLLLPSISEMPVRDLIQRETKQLLPNLGAAAIADPAVAGLQPRYEREIGL